MLMHKPDSLRPLWRSHTTNMFCLLWALLLSLTAAAQQKDWLVRIARLTVDPGQIVRYKALLQEEIETAVRAEPGVLLLYAVSDQKDPAQITVFEIYANAEAYRAHLETPHFKKYKSGTKDMVLSLELSDNLAVAMAAKAHLFKP